ncbi:hypothetical protein BDV10DRAFT_198475 [Aspergillus recurvatus]
MSEARLTLYLTRLLDTLQRELKDNPLAVYLFGSTGYNAYEPETSDVGVYTIIHEPIPDYKELACKISYASIPCPARKLEFILFTKANAALQTRSPQVEMNFNTGRDMEDDYINLDPSTGVSLFGLPAGEVFTAPKVEWHHQQPLLTYDGVLNGCRALRFAKTGKWGSKKEGEMGFLDFVHAEIQQCRGRT